MTAEETSMAFSDDRRQPADEPGGAAAMARAEAYLRRLPLAAQERRQLHQALHHYAGRLERAGHGADVSPRVMSQLHRLLHRHYRWVFDAHGMRLVARRQAGPYIPCLVGGPDIARQPMTPDTPALARRPPGRGRR